MLARLQRLGGRNIRDWINDCRGRSHRHPRTLTIARPHLDGALHGRGAGNDRRPHIDGADGPPGGGGDNGRRYAGVDRKTPSTPAVALAEDDRTIDHDGFANNYLALTQRHDHQRKTRCQQITRLHEGPIGRIVAIFDNNLVRRQRRPTDILRAPAPVDPSRAPFVAPDPDPAKLAIEDPAAIVISHPAPIVLVGIRDPVPAPLVGIDPMSMGIGAPVAGHSAGNPNLAPA